MRAIQKYLPNPRHTEIHRIFVNAEPEQAWQAARHFDAARTPWMKLLFDIRTLPDAILGTKHESASRHLGVDEITEHDTGFMVLNETPGKEVVVGSVGQYWHLNIRFNSVKPIDFAAYNKPGWGKIAWAISVEPFLNGSTIAFELRITATDEDSWSKFNNYYHLISIGSRMIRHSAMSHIELELGKMVLPDDNTRTLPGDDLIPHAKYGLTHHVNIEAPLSIVWRYLMQLGCDRAGWYSIDLLDNDSKPGIDYLVDGWENRQVGDKLDATPKKDSFFDVYDVKNEAHLVIGGETTRIGSKFKMTWAFVTEPIGDDATHLVIRARMETSPDWKEWLLGNIVYPPVHGLMSAVQLKKIKSMSERDAHARIRTQEGIAV